MASPPPLRRPASYAAIWIQQETRLLFREPVAVFFSLGFPLVILAFIGTAYANEEIEEGVRFIEIMFPALLGTVAANLATMGMPGYFADLRSRGVLRWYRTLPLPRWMLGVAVEGSLLILLLASTAIIAMAVGFFYGVRSTAASPLFVLLMSGLVLWLSCLGLLLGALPLKARTIQSVSAAVFFLMFFGSGYAAPIDGLPGWLQAVATANPLRLWFDALVDVYLGATTFSVATGTGLLSTIGISLLTVPLSIRLLGREGTG